MELKPFTTYDAVALVESRHNLQVGEYCQPLVFDGTDGPGMGHRVTVRVTERRESPSDAFPGHAFVSYRGIDFDGHEIEFHPMDDPRRATEGEWNGDE